MHRRFSAAAKLLSVTLLGTMAGCGGSRAPQPDRLVLWYLPSPLLSNESAARLVPGERLPSLGALVVIDSASLRPVVVRAGGSGTAQVRRPGSGRHGDSVVTLLEIDLIQPSVLTTYQGRRYRPETIRALANDSAVMATAARAIVRTTSATGLILDFQGAPPDDIRAMVAMIRSIRDAGRSLGTGPVAVIVPAGDTVSYPTEILSRVADVLLIRLEGEHRPGTPPGPLATPDFIARGTGMRARILGASRLGAELPLYGYRWNRDGTTALMTFVDAQALVIGEARVFTRDPVSQFLTATGRDGWTIWIPDARTVQFMTDAVRRRGINIIALAGVEGADPAIFTPAASNQTMMRSR